MYVVTVTEIVPGENDQDMVNSYHKIVSNLDEASEVVDNFWLNFGVLVSITIVPTA